MRFYGKQGRALILTMAVIVRQLLVQALTQVLVVILE